MNRTQKELARIRSVPVKQPIKAVPWATKIEVALVRLTLVYPQKRPLIRRK